jgi:hypothetical protein
MRGIVVNLRQTSAGCPEQWEGTFETGETLFVRERGGWTRVEVNGIVVNEVQGEPLDVIQDLFDVQWEVFEHTVRCGGSKEGP